MSKPNRGSKMTEFIWGVAVTTAALTARLIIDNMAERTIGKAAMRVTMPAFIISLAVSGGYMLSDKIDPEKGRDRFTYAIMNPGEAGARTIAVVGYEVAKRGGIPNIAKPAMPAVDYSHYSKFRDNIWNPLVTLSRY